MSARAFTWSMIVAAMLAVGAIVVGITAVAQWRNRCEQRGGHAVSMICVSADGRVI